MSSLVHVVRRFLVLPERWWWSHNEHYHGVLLEQIPPGATRALDVGCGTGAFARELAARVEHVDGIDRSADVARARARA